MLDIMIIVIYIVIIRDTHPLRRTPWKRQTARLNKPQPRLNTNEFTTT